MLQQRPLDILPVIIGTAGHVDHGKTTLVKLLTGCDTDRLPEEKRRGLSIDLGFAPCHLSGQRLAGVVDVPGHEDFVRNMVAGAASIDVLMLVIAADDGIMPQTEEHMKIVKLLRTPQVMVVITKKDLVEDDLLELVRDDVRQFMTRMGFPEAPIVCESNRTFEGIDEVRSTLETLVSQVRRRPDPRAFRLNVERVFSVSGHGTVVTGIPISGEARPEDAVELLPTGRVLRVRTVQSYKLTAAAARANTCCAINVRDLQPDEVARGMTLGTPGVYGATPAAIVRLRNVSGAISLKRMTAVKFHSGTAVVNATVKLIGRDQLGPAEDGFALIELEQALVLAAGDRYLVRSLSPAATVGGGTVLSVHTPRRRARHSSDEALRQRLAAAARAAEQGEVLETALLAGPAAVLPAAEVLALTQCAGGTATEQVQAKHQAGVLTPLGPASWLVRSRAGELIETAARILGRFHRDNPAASGLDPARLCRLIKVDPAGEAQFAAVLLDSGRVKRQHDRLALADFTPVVSARDLKLRDALLQRIVAAGTPPPARGNLMAELELAEPEMRRLVRLLVEEGQIKVVGKNLIAATEFVRYREALLRLFTHTQVVDVGAFRDATGLGRNLAVEILEAFDAEGLTRRSAVGRTLARTPAGPS